ncbi:MAG: hypothetical protein JO179_08555 [Solirubrobacterales bacterium]|nr:hypothetical protein [Solirubrobacterales bacterium]
MARLNLAIVNVTVLLIGLIVSAPASARYSRGLPGLPGRSHGDVSEAVLVAGGVVAVAALVIAALALSTRARRQTSPGSVGSPA